MTDPFEPRLFADETAVRHIGEGLVACTLTRPEWTHEAHLAAVLRDLGTARTSSRSGTFPASSAASTRASAG
jgi:hypothetical protein